MRPVYKVSLSSNEFHTFVGLIYCEGELYKLFILFFILYGKWWWHRWPDQIDNRKPIIHLCTKREKKIEFRGKLEG